jgi:hypothetical protein
MKAKKTVWKMFIEKVKNVEGMEVEDLRDQDYNDLAKRNINGRQIKNLTRAAQALAVHEDKPLSMSHIKRVLEVAETFEMDLKGKVLLILVQKCNGLTILFRWYRIHGCDARLHLSDSTCGFCRKRRFLDIQDEAFGVEHCTQRELNWAYSLLLLRLSHIFWLAL